MRINARDHVVQSVAIDVVSKHLRAAAGKWESMLNPNRIIFERCGLLPPSFALEEIHAAITVDISTTQPMGKTLIIALGSNGMKFPGPARIGPIGFSVPHVTAGAANNFRFAVPIYIRKDRRFIIK